MYCRHIGNIEVKSIKLDAFGYFYNSDYGLSTMGYGLKTKLWII
jgi:hypothetical protein